MTVDRTVVVKTELFKDHAAANDALGGLFGLACDVTDGLAAKLLEQAGHAIVQGDVGGVGRDLVEVLGDGPDVFVDGPLVVIQNDDEAFGLRGDVVEGFVADAVGEGSIAGKHDDILVATRHVSRHGHAESGRECGARVTGTEAVVLAFRAQHEAVETARLANGIEAIFAAGEEFVDIALVRYVENKAVAGSVKDVVHGERELDDTEVGTDMATGLGNATDEPLADLFG